VLILPIAGAALRAYHRLLNARVNMNDAEKSSCEVGILSIYVVLPYPEDLADMKCALLRVRAYRPHGIRGTRPSRGWMKADWRAVGLPGFIVLRWRQLKTRLILSLQSACILVGGSGDTGLSLLANTVNIIHATEDLLC
jgi:hypothetical protein